jgi:HAMP domain-containing protein
VARSIRHGLFAALAGFTVLICVCYTGLALVISYVTEDMLIDRLLKREAAAMTAHFRLHGDIRPAADEIIRAYRSVEALPPIVREQVVAGRGRAEIFTDTGQHYHLRSLDLPAQSGPQRIYLLADVRPLLVVTKLFQDVGGVLIAVALGLIALALLLAYLLSKRLVSPLQVLANEVRGLSQKSTIELSARHRPDEIGYLAKKLGTTIAELHSSLNREHAFTRDVSHELRTPLTVMNNIVALAQARALDTDDVAQLQAGLDEIGTTIDVLFALARAEHIAQETGICPCCSSITAWAMPCSMVGPIHACYCRSPTACLACATRSILPGPAGCRGFCTASICFGASPRQCAGKSGFMPARRRIASRSCQSARTEISRNSPAFHRRLAILCARPLF